MALTMPTQLNSDNCEKKHPNFWRKAVSMTLDITMQRLLTDTRDRSGGRDPVEGGVAGDVALPDLGR